MALTLTGERAARVRWICRLVAAATLAMAALAVLTTGCRPQPALGKVHGQVRFQGQPIQAGIVGFDNDATGVHMTANLDAEGRYQVSMAKGLGLPPGTYRVAVYPLVADLPIGSTVRPQPREFPEIPVRYRQPSTSHLTLTVHEGDNPFDIEMQP